MVSNSRILEAGEGRAGLCQQGGPSYRRAAACRDTQAFSPGTPEAFPFHA